MAVAQANITVPKNSCFSSMKDSGQASVLFFGVKIGGKDAEPLVKLLAMEIYKASQEKGLLPSKTSVEFKNNSDEPMDAKAFFQFLVNSHRLTHGESYPISNDRAESLQAQFIFAGSAISLGGELAEKVDAIARGHTVTWAFMKQFGVLPPEMAD